MPYLGEIAGLSAALVWTFSAFVWARVGTGLTAFSINAFKAATGFLIMTVVVAVHLGVVWPTALSGRQLLILLISGVIGLGLGDAFYFMALLMMGARRSLLMWLTAPAMAAILGMLFLGPSEAIGWIGWTGMALTALGIVIVQTEAPAKTEEFKTPVTPKVILWGSLAGLVASFGQAVASLMMKMVLNEAVHPLQVVQVRLAAATVFLAAGGVILGRMSGWIGQFKEKRVLGHGLFAVLLGTVAGLSLMTLSLKLIRIGLSNTLTSTSPLFAIPFAFLFFKAKLSFRTVVGTLVAFAGVAMVFLE